MGFFKSNKGDLSNGFGQIENNEQAAMTASDGENMINTIDNDEFAFDENALSAMLDKVADENVSEESLEAAMEDMLANNGMGFSEMAQEEDKAEEVAVEAVDMMSFGAVEEGLQSTEELIASDEISEITKGTVVMGGIETDGSLNVYGRVKGDVTCKGKLVVGGRITGNSVAKEIFANNAKIDGELHSDGTVKIGNGSVIDGNIYATSAVIGGAVKGDIDVQGPVIIDGTAVVHGNIKSRSVQINNGAVIEGFCSQCYAEVDYKSLFEDAFAND